MYPIQDRLGFRRARRMLARGLTGAGLVWALAACDKSPTQVEVEPPPPPGSVRAKLLELGLDSLSAPIQTYFSPGAEARAQSLQSWLRAADRYFQARLGVQPRFRLAVLNEEHWAAISPGPYGVPHVADSATLVVLPAVPDRSVVSRIYGSAQPGLPAHAAEDLARLGVSYQQAALQSVDLIGFHEVGHVYIRALGYTPTNTARWLEELLATYAAYSYLQVSNPSAITVWNALSEAILGHVTPVTRSLDDFNRLYFGGLGPATYGWFQSHFNLRDAVVVEERTSAIWFAQLRAAGLDQNTQSIATSELLRRLDGTVPGFTDWANTVGLEYK